MQFHRNRHRSRNKGRLCPPYSQLHCLQLQHKLEPHSVSVIAIIYNSGAICGGLLFGILSEHYGRRKCIVTAALLSLAVIPLWAFAETDIARLIAGALPTNVGSQRVLEKAGFHREAYLRSRLPGPDGTRTDDVQFVLLAEDLLVEGPRLDG